MLILTEARLHESVPLSAAFDYAAIRPYAEQAEAERLLPLLGTTLYAQLAQSDAPTPEQEHLLRMASTVAANHAVRDALPVLQLNIDAAGIRIANTEQYKTAFQWQIRDLEDQLLAQAGKAADRLLTHLNAARDQYPDWVDEAEADNFPGFLNTASEYTSVIPLLGNRRDLFEMIRPIMLDLEDPLLSLLGDRLQQLRTAHVQRTTAPEDRPLLRLLQRYLGHRSFAAAIVELRLQVDGRGLTVYDSTDANAGKARRAAGADVSQDLSRSHDARANAALRDLQTLLYTASGEEPPTPPRPQAGGAYLV